jgi:hypothetical protein
MTPTVGGIPVKIGETYYAMRGDVPREVVDIAGSTVIVRDPESGREWGVRRFAYNYYRKSEK